MPASCALQVGTEDLPKYRDQGGKDRFAEILRMHTESGDKLVTFFDVKEEEEELSQTLLKAVIKWNMPHEGGAGGDGGDDHGEQLEHAHPPTRLTRTLTLSESSQKLINTRQTKEEEEQQQRLGKALKLAVLWNRPTVASDVLERLGSMRQAFPQGPGTTDAVRQALQLAVERDCVEFTETLLNLPGSEVSTLDMTALYQLPGRFKFLTQNEQLRQGFAREFDLARPSRDCYRPAVAPLLKGISHRLYDLVYAEERVSYSDLFLWALFAGHFEMAKM